MERERKAGCVKNAAWRAESQRTIAAKTILWQTHLGRNRQNSVSSACPPAQDQTERSFPKRGGQGSTDTRMEQGSDKGSPRRNGQRHGKLKCSPASGAAHRPWAARSSPPRLSGLAIRPKARWFRPCGNARAGQSGKTGSISPNLKPSVLAAAEMPSARKKGGKSYELS